MNYILLIMIGIIQIGFSVIVSSSKKKEKEMMPGEE
jgi:hypothetical protein